MGIREFECRSYQQAVYLLGGRYRRKLCNNTYLRRDIVSSGLGVYLHGHLIVLFQKDAPMRITSCGYKMVTTKQRINRCLPLGYYLYQHKFVWLIAIPQTGTSKQTTRTFFDGMQVEIK